MQRESTHDGKSNGLAARCFGNESCYQIARAYPGEYLFFANEVPGVVVPGSIQERMRRAAEKGGDHERAEGTIRLVALGRHDEVMARLQPAEIAVIERFPGSKLQHDRSSTADSMGVRIGNGYGVETIGRLVSELRTRRSIR